MAKVSFIIAGMQKAGTTALYEYLKLHSDLYMPSQKELHFFDNETAVDWNHPDYRAYECHFDAASAAQLCGEATPIYTYWPSSLERIASYNSEMKLIILLRDRVDRAYSQWKMLRAMGHEHLDFSDAIRSGRNRLRDFHNIDLANRWFTYVERGFYAPQISQAISLFSHKNVLVINNQDLLKTPATALSQVYDFLAIQQPFTMPQTHFVRPIEPLNNVSPLRDADREYLSNLYNQDTLNLEELLKSFGL